MGKKRSVAVIGLGTFGIAVSMQLTKAGDRVLGIDIDQARVARVAGEIDEAVQLDATDSKALQECAVGEHDAIVICIGENIETSILTCMNVLELGCAEIWVKAQSGVHERILSRLGDVRVVLPEAQYGEHVAQMVHNPLIQDYLSVGEGQYIAQLHVPPALAGKTIEEVTLEEGLAGLAVRRDSELLPFDNKELELTGSDTLILHGPRTALRRFSDQF